MKLDQYEGRKVPKSLLNLVSIHLKEVPLEEALLTIAKEGNLQLNYNRNRIPVHREVSLNVSDAHALEALLQVLSATGTELRITKQGHLVIVPSKINKRARGTITGRIMDRETKEPLFGTNITITGTYLGGTSNPKGEFAISNIPSGNYSLQFSYIGYKTEKIENVHITEDISARLDVALIPKPIMLKEIVVTPGQFSIMGSTPAVRQTLTHENLQTVTFGEDVYRAITRLPGISSSDFSAKFTMRGGENEQILVLMDGMELYEPFHLKEIEGGALSIIDVAAIQGIDLLTGSFPAEFGDRLSGVFNIHTSTMAQGNQRTSLGISLMNARIMSEGTFLNDRGSWLFSARRGYMDIVLNLLNEDNPPKPKYYDILGKITYQLNRKHSLSVNLLHAGDKLDYIDNDHDESNNNYGNSYVWLNLKSILNSNLYVHTILSYMKMTHQRQGIAFTDFRRAIDFKVSDSREILMTGLKQNWELELSKRWTIKWGFDLKHLSARYDYNCLNRHSNRVDTTTTHINPAGQKMGGFLTHRFQALPNLITELGLRYDHSSYTSDRLFSPRFNLVVALGPVTFLRGGWGYFYQSEGIHEIKVADGEDQFYPAELARHWIAGFEHTFRNGINCRVEGYYKKLSHLRPDYRNWTNAIEMFPELLDRFQLNLYGATSKGIEFYFKYDQGGRFSCWASYALASFKDDIRSLIFEGVEYSDTDGEQPGRFDQRHTLYLDLNYRPDEKWHMNIAWQFHTGWPYTESIMRFNYLPDGSREYYPSYGDYHGASYPPYHRLDLKITRHFYTASGRLSASAALINIYDHGNVRNYTFYSSWRSLSNLPYMAADEEYGFKLLPSIGISYSWNH